MKQRLLFLFYFLPIGLLFAQTLTTFNYSLEQGLPSSEVYQVYEDKEGFIWFATDNGVVRYDGSEMQTFHVKDGLSDPVVFGFQEDEEGRIWFVSYTGRLSYFESGSIKKYQYNDKISQIVQSGIPTFQYSAKKKELKILSRHNLGGIDSLGNVTIEKIKEEGLHYFGSNTNGIWGLTSHSQDTNKIFINEKEFPVTLSKEPYKLSHYLSPSRCIQWRNKLYLTIRNNIYCFDGIDVKPVYAGHAPIISLSIDNENDLWIGYMSGGAEKHSSQEFNSPKRFPILDELSISGILQDKGNGIWMSTLEKGVFYIPNSSINNITPENNPKILHVITHGDSIFKSNQNGELEIINGNSQQTIWSKTFNSPASYFYFTKNEKLFLLSGPNTYVFNKSMEELKKHGVNSSSIIEQKNGNLWNYGDGAVREFDSEGNLIFRKKLFESYRSFILHNSMFYMASKTGLHVRNSDFEIVKSPENLGDFKISQLFELNDSTIMISTLGSGFLLLNTRTLNFKKFDTENLFVANNIYTVVKSGTKLWLGTEVGIILLDIKSLQSGSLSFIRWDKHNGLISDNIKFIGHTKNKVWAFSDNGYSIIPKNQFDREQKTPTPYLKSLAFNENIYQTNFEQINLNYKNSNINIKIGYLSFTNQKIISRYRISKNTEWKYTMERSFQFTSLAPGDYSFDLEYSIDNVHWIPTEIKFAFKVNPPWWQQWYFVSGFVLGLLTIVFLYARFQIKNYQQKNNLLNLVNIQQQKLVYAEIKITERERKRIAKELHDGVGTSLTAIRLGVMSQLTRNSNDTLAAQEIENQFQSALKEIKNIAYDLTPPDLERYGFFTALTGYVNKLSFSIGMSIELNTYGKDLPESDVALSVFRILQELISNSLKHAKAKKISITINGFDDLMSIIFEDDGIGFDPIGIEKGLGLANIESRVQLLNGNIQMESMNFGVSYLIDIPIKENNLD